MAISESWTHAEFERFVGKYAADGIEAFCAEGKCKKLPLKPINESTHFIIGGPAGSGKGVLTRDLLAKGELDLSRTISFVSDNFHELIHVGGSIALGDNAAEASDLCHVVLQPIMENARKKLEIHQRTKGTSPDVLSEVIVLSDERMVEWTKIGQKVRGFTTCHLKPDLMFAGSQERGKKTGRFVSSEYIVLGARGVSAVFPRTVERMMMVNKGNFNARIEMMNTAHIHEPEVTPPHTPVVICDSVLKRMVVYQFDAFLKFNMQQQLVIPKEGEPVQRVQCNDDDMVNRFMRDYGSVLQSFVFIDPKIPAEDVAKPGNYAYAYFDEETNLLVIHNQEIYDRVCQENPIIQKFFNKVRTVQEQTLSMDVRP